MARIWYCGVVSFLLSPHLWAQGLLEFPQIGSNVSGIGVVAGWECEASLIEISFDSSLSMIQIPSGGTHSGSELVCADTDNGFATRVNWSILGDGSHTVQVFGDGVLFATASVTVTTFGTSYLVGASGTFILPDFPEDNTPTTIDWNQLNQNFEIVNYTP